MRSFLLSLVVMAAGCGAKSSTPVDAQATPEPAKSGPSEAQILEILKVTHQGEIDAGKMALEKSGDQRVKDFAQMMIDQHTEAMGHIDSLAAKIGAAPAASKRSSEVAAHNQETASKLRDPVGSDFDKAYASAMVDGHQHVLDAIRTDLAPQATSVALRDELSALDKAVTMHLEHAKTLKDQLSK